MDRSILVAEDDRAINEILTLLLKSEGYTVYPALTVGEALRILDRASPDFFILDYLMEDGNTCAPLVRAASNGTRVIIMTASSMRTEDIAHITGIPTVIRKPFDFDIIMKALEHAHTHQTSYKD